MRRVYGWLVVLVIVALFAAACGPKMATPTPVGAEVAEAPAAEANVEDESEPQPSPPEDLPVDEGDWHVLGSPDAPVTVIEYSDFQ
jgi:protein-disulfide isomerase